VPYPISHDMKYRSGRLTTHIEHL